VRYPIFGLVIAAGAAVLVSAPAGHPQVVNDGHGDYVYVPAGAFKMGDNFGEEKLASALCTRSSSTRSISQSTR
jgi:oxalate decarboxylase/phosphoglucose isomerase-like protein (cupin superfamily)